MDFPQKNHLQHLSQTLSATSTFEIVKLKLNWPDPCSRLYCKFHRLYCTENSDSKCLALSYLLQLSDKQRELVIFVRVRPTWEQWVPRPDLYQCNHQHLWLFTTIEHFLNLLLTQLDQSVLPVKQLWVTQENDFQQKYLKIIINWWMTLL